MRLQLAGPQGPPYSPQQEGSESSDDEAIREIGMFIRNTWYVAAFAAEIAPGKALGRKFLNEAVVLFRTQQGEIAALEDRCSHRAMPLSAGHVDGDVIRCCYHGVEFNGKAPAPASPTSSAFLPPPMCATIPWWKRSPDLDLDGRACSGRSLDHHRQPRA
jgi:vanillate O-demethylase monooxygenase subunit